MLEEKMSGTSIRLGSEDDLDEIFLMGYDAWGAELPVEMYLESCRASYKYKLGEFYVLEDWESRLICSCIVYPLKAFGGVVSEQAVGIGSLATAMSERHRGYATLFLTLLMQQLEKKGVDAFFIHSDIHPKIYETLGFEAVPGTMREKNSISVPMLRLSGARPVASELWSEIVLPTYF